MAERPPPYSDKYWKLPIIAATTKPPPMHWKKCLGRISIIFTARVGGFNDLTVRTTSPNGVLQRTSCSGSLAGEGGLPLIVATQCALARPQTFFPLTFKFKVLSEFSFIPSFFNKGQMQNIPSCPGNFFFAKKVERDWSCDHVNDKG